MRQNDDDHDRSTTPGQGGYKKGDNRAGGGGGNGGGGKNARSHGDRWEKGDHAREDVKEVADQIGKTGEKYDE